MEGAPGDIVGYAAKDLIVLLVFIILIGKDSCALLPLWLLLSHLSDRMHV